MRNIDMRYEPKVTIVIPVYNGSNFLAEAIDCALAQQMTVQVKRLHCHMEKKSAIS